MGKCAECGFLTMRNMVSGELDDLDKDFRETGNPPHRTVPAVGGAGMRFTMADTTPYRHVPICFAQAVNLAEEWPASRELQEKYKDWPASLVLEVITKERPECEGKFTEWQQGFTPKEHQEMLDRERLLRLEEERRKADRRWRLFELIMFGAAGAAVAIVAALVERGTIG